MRAECRQSDREDNFNAIITSGGSPPPPSDVDDGDSAAKSSKKALKYTNVSAVLDFSLSFSPPSSPQTVTPQSSFALASTAPELGGTNSRLLVLMLMLSVLSLQSQ